MVSKTFEQKKESNNAPLSDTLKQNVKIITSGSSYVDIDAYGGCIAYAELLNLQGRL